MDKKLPDFELCLARGSNSLQAADLAALHGVICGLLCAKPDLGMGDLERILPRLGRAEVLDPETPAWLPELLAASQAQFGDEQMGLVIWLPDDETELTVRSSSLAEWCNGVLAGLSELAGDSLNRIVADIEAENNADIAEALEDFTAIARLAGQAVEPSEENEADFVQISEYCRVAVLLFQEMLRGPCGDDSIH